MNGADLIGTGLRRMREGRWVVDGVDLRVCAGRTLVLLGASGAGKTTLLRIVAGLDRADAGRVCLGERVLSDPVVRVPPESRGVGMVFQALELWPQMSVAEHLAFGLPRRPRGRSARRHPRVRELAAQVGLPENFLGRRPSTLSGGEQQRVAIARTLAPEPDVVLYDEPLANLDPDRRRALRSLIRRLARTHGTTLVYVTHDAEEALEIGDEVAVMAAGRIVEQGPPQQLYRHPRSLAAARALGPVTVLPGESDGRRVRTLLGEHELPETAGPVGRCRVLWRPEALCSTAHGTLRVRVEDVMARGTDWAFQGTLAGETILGRSALPLLPGQEVAVRAERPAAVLTATGVEEVPA